MSVTLNSVGSRGQISSGQSRCWYHRRGRGRGRHWRGELCRQRLRRRRRRSAELAFTVEEDFQSRGIGSLLMRHIIAIARVKGLDRQEADVLSRNRPMLNVFRRCGLPMTVRHEGDVIHVILSLRQAG
jgi:GNAT superfamily N-acetyltransferase